MRFTEDMQGKINEAFDEKKRANPISHIETGLGIDLYSGLSTADVYRDGSWVCRVEELSRMIEELTMLKDAVEELTGVVL